MKKLSKIIRSGKFDNDVTYAALLGTYQNSRHTCKQSKQRLREEEENFDAALEIKGHEVQDLFRMHSLIKELRFAHKINRIDRKLAKRNLKNWLAEKKKRRASARSEKVVSEMPAAADENQATTKSVKKSEKKQMPLDKTAKSVKKQAKSSEKTTPTEGQPEKGVSKKAA